MIAFVARLPRFTTVSQLADALIPRPSTLAILALISANVIWGGSAVASKVVLTHVPPLTLASLRVAIALMLLRFLLVWNHERPTTGTATALLGLTGVALFCACQNLGLLLADASTTALLNGATPVLTIGFAAPILHERLSVPRLTALLVCALGVSLIVLLGPGATPGTGIVKSSLPMASAIAFALYTVLGRRAFSKGSPLAVVTGSTQYGLLFLLPGTAFEITRVEVSSMTTQDLLLLLYLGAGCSALAFLLCGYGLCRLEAGHSAVFGNLKPVVGVALAVVFLGEPLTGTQAGGGLLILLGVGIAAGRWLPERGWSASSRRDEPTKSLNDTLPSQINPRDATRYIGGLRRSADSPQATVSVR